MKPIDLRVEKQIAPLALSTQTPRFSWKLPYSADAQKFQTAYHILVASRIGLLKTGGADCWDSGRISGDRSWLVQYGGKTLLAAEKYYWRVRVWTSDGEEPRWSDVSQFGIGLLSDADWNADWIAMSPDEGTPAGRHCHVQPLSETQLEPWRQVPELRKASICLRKTFELARKPLRALVHLCGLGHYRMWCNGRRVGNDELQPAWSDYDRRCHANTYDITDMLTEGRNNFSVLLGNGFYNVVGARHRYAKLYVSFGAPKLRLAARLIHDDTTRETITSDRSWRVAKSALDFNCIYGGEDFDARRHDPAWIEPSYDDSTWQSALPAKPPKGMMVPQCSLPLQYIPSLSGSLLSQPAPGILVYDLRQNHAGMPFITVQGPAGSRVRLMPGETVGSDGLVEQGSASGPNSKGRTYFDYILKGGGAPEQWSPVFSYYGYRYIQVELSPAPDSIDKKLPVPYIIDSLELHNTAPIAGTWESSDPLLNRIHSLILAAARSNLQHVLTDCPHREKLGWIEVSYLMGSSLSYNFDLHLFFSKILDDMTDAQQADGLVPSHVPEYSVFEEGFRDSPEWGSAIIHICEILYQWYGDESAVVRHYGAMRRYANYLLSKTQGGLLMYGLGDWMDAEPPDGSLPGPSQLTGLGVTATATLVRSLRTLARLARIAGHDDDVSQWSKLADLTRDAFNKRFFDSKTGIYDTGSQTALAMPLALGIVEPCDVARVLQRLIERIANDGYHIRAGDIGHAYVIAALSGNNCNELLWKIVTRKTPPSYGGMIAAGATTLAESWNADPRLSLNHLMLGHVEQWLYRHIVGFQPDEGESPWRHILIRPWFPPGVTWVRSRYESPHGEYACSWERIADTQIRIEITIPSNTTARFEASAGYFIKTLLSKNSSSKTCITRMNPGKHTIIVEVPA